MAAHHQRRAAGRLRRGLLAACCLLIALPGCVTGGKVEQDTERMAEVLRASRLPAYYCAPKDLALAEANIEFARDASKRGDTITAYMHLKDAELHTAKVFKIKDKKGCCPDRDGDRVCDAADRCPDDPEDYDGDEDDDGCPEFDRDGDGIRDADDRCPDQAEDRDGYKDDDGCPEADNDADGIPDKRDRCPNVVEDKDGYADADGCPEFDNDRDGINDATDKCPLKPEVYNGKDDLDGCPDKLPPKPKPKVYKNIVVKKDKIEFKKQIKFKTGSARIISKISEEILDEASDALQGRQDVRVQVEGHTDERGSARYNKRLSQKRAESVVNALVKRGIARSRLIPIGFGEDRPLDPAHNKAAWKKNRRVEFNFLMD